jgi:hypothetical protein
MPATTTTDRRAAQAALKAKKREHFAWQEHVAAHRDLKPAVKLVLLRLAFHRNLETDRCDPSYGTLAKGANVSERTAVRAITEGEQKGLISITRTIGGRYANTNSFRFTLPEGVTRESPVGVTNATGRGDTASTGGVTPVSPKYEENTLGAPTEPPNKGERENAPSALDHSPGVAAALEGPRAKFEGSKQDAIREGRGDAYAELRTIWARPWTDDEGADRRAFEAACQRAEPEEIIQAARAYVAAADAPRFLPVLAKWLGTNGWTKAPPKPAARQHAARGRSPHRNNGRKVDVARLALMHGGYVEDEDGALVWGGGQ